MNVSPHHQHPTEYPWPGMASRLAVVLAIVVVLVIGYMLIADPFGSESEDTEPTAVRVTAEQGL